MDRERKMICWISSFSSVQRIVTASFCDFRGTPPHSEMLDYIQSMHEIALAVHIAEKLAAAQEEMRRIIFKDGFLRNVIVSIYFLVFSSKILRFHVPNKS